MNAALLIARKRDGHALAPEEIHWLIENYARGDVPDYQMAALAMAIYLRGMTAAETAALTRSMLESGAQLAWPERTPPRVDKHSTGGVGDKISLILAPLLACCDLWVPMISGRGLGATGGTLDKLEAIPGFRANLDLAEILAVTEQVGCVITGSTADLVPADKKLYALRDVTATVSTIPLIASSIMSKKLAEGLDALVLDVKFGSGAFIKPFAEAQKLARAMVEIGDEMGLRTTALLTDMNQPLGRMIGNAVEVDESVEVLAGGGPADVIELTLALGAELLVLADAADDHEQATRRLTHLLQSGEALAKFREMVAAQGGDLDAPRPVAPAQEIVAQRAGCLTAVHTEQLGVAVVELGGGRQKITDAIDFSVGLEMLVRLGERVVVGQPLVRVFAPPEKAEHVTPLIRYALTIDGEPYQPGPLVVERITSR